MNITLMKAKNVAVGIKNGMTSDDFCNKYQCSLDEFQERVKQLYGHNKKQLKNCFVQITANEKKARKEPVEVEDANESAESTKPVAEEQSPEKVSKRRTVELAYLAELEDQQSRRVMTLESEHKELSAEHRSLKMSLRKLSDNIDKLMTEFQTHYQEFDEILSRNSEVEARMSEITAEWTSERTALSDTRSQIEELSVVTLCVYASGEISPIDGCEIDLDDSGWESTKEVLLVKDDCQELRLKDITTLAKLLMIVEHADSKIEAICDNAELEAAFQKMRSK